MKNSLLSKTAILFFAYSPEEELRKKPLWNGYSFLKDLNQNTIRQIEKSGVDYFHFSEKEQVGSNFGERFVYAIQAVFNKGYEHIITLGNDTPHLRTRHIVQAIDHLQEGEIVIGPSSDGGFYMLGLSRSQFEADLFIDLPWQTAKLRSALNQAFLTLNQKIYQLPVLMDLDSIIDIRRLVRRSFNIPISMLKYLLTINEHVSPSTKEVEQVFIQAYPSIHFNKGSPHPTN